MAETDTQAGGMRKTPTEKMLTWATTVASRFNTELTDEQKNDFEACKAFLDAHPVVPPSEAQIRYAERISEEADVGLPDAARTDFKAMSAWLNEHAPRD